jgi:hypothetical protein
MDETVTYKMTLIIASASYLKKKKPVLDKIIGCVCL